MDYALNFRINTVYSLTCVILTYYAHHLILMHVFELFSAVPFWTREVSIPARLVVQILNFVLYVSTFIYLPCNTPRPLPSTACRVVRYQNFAGSESCYSVMPNRILLTSRDVPEVVNRRPVTAKPRLLSQAIPCGIFGEQSNEWTRLSLSTFSFISALLFHQCAIAIISFIYHSAAWT